LTDEAVARLLERALPAGTDEYAGSRMLDLGCGRGEWLVRALERRPGLRAVGVDLSAGALAEARESARRRGVEDRLELRTGDANEAAGEGGYDLVACVGAAHAFGGLRGTIEAAGRHVAPGGRLLVGDGFWEGKPTPEAEEIFGEFPDLAGTVGLAVQAGWAPVYGHISTREELDEYEWCWTGALTAAALEPGFPAEDREQALSLAAEHRAEWLRDYRDCFGFVCLVLQRS
jgi:SAM-dependent methyltransferase